jgi:hypothetical protein
MKRAASSNEAKRGGAVSSQRLAAAGSQALEAHARVRRFAEQLSEEMDETTPSLGIPTTNLDPEDSMVVSVGRAIAVTSSVATVSEAATASIASPERRPTATKLGMGAPPSKSPKADLSLPAPPKK